MKQGRSIRTGIFSLVLILFAGFLLLNNVQIGPIPSADASITGSDVTDFEPVSLNQATVSVASQELLSSIYEQALPAVVNIQVTNQTSDSSFGAPGLPQGGEGTGWVWDNDGHIVTNNHVVEDAQKILVNFANGTWAEAELIARDPQADLAVIRVDPPAGTPLVPLTISNEPLKVGHYTIALGSPFGLDGTMTLGIVSALGRSFAVGDTAGTRYSLPEVIQTDAAINPGNSGGPLLNLSGEVVGVNFAIRSSDRANSGVGFAIPISVVRRVVPALIEDGAYSYPYLGIRGSTIDAVVAEQEELPNNVLGVFVADVLAGGPSAEGGLEDGDIILSIDGQGIRSFEDLIGYLITETDPGQSVALQILRDGETITADVELSARPESVQPTRRLVTVAEAIEIAKEAAEELGISSDEIESASAQSEVEDGDAVWVVTIEGDGRTAVVTVDATSGEVVSSSIEE